MVDIEVGSIEESWAERTVCTALANANVDLRVELKKITTKWFIDANNTKEEIEKIIDFVESRCPIKDTIERTPELNVVINGAKNLTRV